MKIGNVSGTLAPMSSATSASATSLIGFAVRSMPNADMLAAPADTMHMRPL